MRFRIVDNPNGDFNDKDIIGLLLIEPTDTRPVCFNCKRELLDKEYCYYSKARDLFNCSGCLTDCEINGVKTGERMPTVLTTFSPINVMPCKLVIQNE